MRISAAEAHVWTVGPEDPPARRALPRLEAVLCDHERQRMRRFRFERDRVSFLLAHGLARAVLSWCCPAVHPAAWQFEHDPHGRPEVAGPAVAPGVRFNLSHTDGLVACVVTLGADCGIDVEGPLRAADLEGLARRLLTPGERRWLARQPERERRAGFVALWTLKEAYAKARGLGLSLPFDRVAFDLDRPHRIRLLADPALEGDAAGWTIQQWRPTDRHLAAVAIRQPATRVVRHDHSPPLDAADHPALGGGDHLAPTAGPGRIQGW